MDPYKRFASNSSNFSKGEALMPISIRPWRICPAPLRGVRPENTPHSAWELLEHLRIAQWDMLAFSRDPDHVSPDWPAGYWPKDPAPPKADSWDESDFLFRRDNEQMRQLVSDPSIDLFTPFAYGEGQNLLREALQLGRP